MDDLECPYCEQTCEPDESGSAEDEEIEKECPHCGKYFTFFVNYYPSYSSHKAPCLNGEPHKYEPIVGYPKEYYKNRFRCKYCGKEEIIDNA